MSAKVKKLSASKVGIPLVTITLPPGVFRNYLFGKKCVAGADGCLSVTVEADPNVLQIVRDLHPDWLISEPFYELRDTVQE